MAFYQTSFAKISPDAHRANRPFITGGVSDLRRTNPILTDTDCFIVVRIHWDDVGWYLRNPNGTYLFPFDLPEEMIRLYANEGFLSTERALDLKVNLMSSFQAITLNEDGFPTPINFELDREWIEVIRKSL